MGTITPKKSRSSLSQRTGSPIQPPLALVVAALLLGALSCGDGSTEPAPPPPPTPVPTTVTVSPETAGLAAFGATAQLSAQVFDQNGSVMTGQTVAWSSNNDAVATVAGSGLVTAVGNGTATITATAGAASGAATVTVEQVVTAMAVSPESGSVVQGDGLPLSATPTDANGHEAPDAEVSWASADPSVARVDDTGFVTGAGVGQTEVSATAGTAAATAHVTVTPPPTEVVISPPGDTLDSGQPLAMTPGDSISLTGEAFDAEGNPVPATLAWLSSDSTIARVDSAGTVIGLRDGSATLTLRWSPSGRAANSTASSASLAAPDLVRRATVADTISVNVVNPDRGALVAFYDSAGGDGWSNSDNWLSNRPLREWRGVRAEDVYGRVDGLDLRGNGLTGRIAPELGELTKLVDLDLGANSLEGGVPGALGAASSLRSLHVDANQLEGRLPDELLRLSLTTLRFDGNSGLCAPPTDGYRNWLARIGSVSGPTCRLTGTVWAADKGLEGVTVVLSAPSGAPRDTTVTDGNGEYAFSDLLDGDYTVTLGVHQQWVCPGCPHWGVFTRPDGRQIQFSTFDAPVTLGVGKSEIVDFFGFVRIFGFGYDPRYVAPAWSPDSRRLAFSTALNSTIYIINADGTGAKHLTVSGHGFEYRYDPAWSPDGRSIAFASSTNQGYRDIHVMNADGTGGTNLTNSPHWEDRYPTWSPDGRSIAFVTTCTRPILVCRESGALIGIRVMNSDGTDARWLKRTNELNRYYHELAWSPDGSRMAYTLDTVHDRELYVMNANGTGAMRLTREPERVYGAAWSPDSRKIAYSTLGHAIWVMNADGTGGVTQLTRYPWSGIDPAWSPDGKIAFVCSNLQPRSHSICVLKVPFGNRAAEAANRAHRW